MACRVSQRRRWRRRRRLNYWRGVAWRGLLIESAAEEEEEEEEEGDELPILEVCSFWRFFVVRDD